MRGKIAKQYRRVALESVSLDMKEKNISGKPDETVVRARYRRMKSCDKILGKQGFVKKLGASRIPAGIRLFNQLYVKKAKR